MVAIANSDTAQKAINAPKATKSTSGKWGLPFCDRNTFAKST